MIRANADWGPDQACCQGLRMTAKEYLALGETFIHYELIDGVVIMSPSPSLTHQEIITNVCVAIRSFLDKHPLGVVVPEIDVNLSAELGCQTVYRPDVVYLRNERIERMGEKISGPPDLVVEVVSPDSRQYDSITKKNDYERAGVGEYWLIDPLEDRMTFYIRRDRGFVEQKPQGDRFTSSVVPGLVLDLTPLRKRFGQR